MMYAQSGIMNNVPDKTYHNTAGKYIQSVAAPDFRVAEAA